MILIPARYHMIDEDVVTMMGDGTAANELSSIALSLQFPTSDLDDPLRQAGAAIDTVHRITALPSIPIVREDIALGERYFEINVAADQPVKIAISSDALQPEWTLVHEIGHFLDFSGFGASRAFASPLDDRFDDWRATVQASDAVKRLAILRSNASDALRWRAIDHLLRYHELWAWSYVQYITGKCGHPRLLLYLRWRRDQALHPRYLPRQWEDTDFEPISETIDALFGRLG